MLSHYIHYDLQLEEINKGIRQFLRYEASQASEFFMPECHFYGVYVRYLPNLNYLQIHRIALWWEINEKIPIAKVHVHSCIHNNYIGFLAIISIAIKRVLVILKCRKIILFLREAAERCSWGRRNSFFARWSCGCGFRYSNNIHHFLCWKWKYFYKFFLKPWVCIFVLRVNITWNITICPRSGWDSTEWRAMMITDHGIVDVVGVGDHGLGEAWLHHIDHALLRIQHL